MALNPDLGPLALAAICFMAGVTSGFAIAEIIALRERLRSHRRGQQGGGEGGRE